MKRMIPYIEKELKTGKRPAQIWRSLKQMGDFPLFLRSKIYRIAHRIKNEIRVDEMGTYRLRDELFHIIREFDQLKHEIARQNDYRTDSDLYYAAEKLEKKIKTIYDHEDLYILQKENELLKLEHEMASSTPQIPQITSKVVDYHYCISCGRKIQVTSIYCDYCGVKQ